MSAHSFLRGSYEDVCSAGIDGVESSPNDHDRGGRGDADGGRGACPAGAISRPLAANEVASDPLVDGFVEQRVLADLLFRKCIRRLGAGLVSCGGRAYRLREAIRVLGRADGHSDPYGLTGAVETLDELLRAGASVSAGAMQLGSATYLVERGVLASAREQGAGVEAPDWLSA